MPRKTTQSDFIQKCINKHGNEYNYDKTVYTGSDNKVIVTCKIHGDFSQQAYKHANRGDKCPKCSYENRQDSSKLTTESFIERSIGIHSDLYIYDRVVYKSYTEKVEIYCKTHGYFMMRPANHIATKPQGCPKCGIEETTKKNKLTASEFIAMSKDVHGEKYEYDKVKYIDGTTCVTITCKEHGDFEQRPMNHIHQKSGCPYCNTAHGGFKLNKPGILYYLSINKGQAYKIGITNKTVFQRFSIDELKSIDVIMTWHYENGKEAYEQEQKILKEYEMYKYTGDNLIAIGNTELFNCDILLLDNTQSEVKENGN